MSDFNVAAPGGSVQVTLASANPAAGHALVSANPPVAYQLVPGVLPLPNPLGFIGTALRLPTATLTKSGNNYVAGDMAMGMPPWEVDEIWFCFPVGAFTNSGYVACPNGYTHEGMATRASDGQRTLGSMDDAGTSIVIDPSDGSMTYGRWIKFTPAAPIPANTILQVFTFAQYIPDGTFPRNRGGTVETVNRFGGTIPDERSQGSSSSLLSTLSGSTSYNNSAGELVWPCAAMARKPSGELSAISIGTSIGYGVNNTTAVLRDNRGEFGFMSRGLDDNTDSGRISNLNWCIPGWNHVSTDTAKSHTNETAAAPLLWLMDKARALNAGRPLVDQIWSEHGTNSSGTQSSLRADYRALFDLWRTSVGDDDTPVYQAEMLPYASSTDGYATLGNQSTTAANTYSTGTRWLLNSDIGGPDGDGDPTANLRADGTIQASFAPWKETAHDLTTNRDKFSVRAFNTTLAATYSGSGTVSLTAEPTVGDSLFIKDGATEGACIVLSYTGTGPYLVTPLWVAGSGSTYTSGSTVRSIWHDNNGLHPGPLAFDEYMTSLTALKVALGFEAPPDVTAPTITSADPSGSYEEGVEISGTLTADEAVTWTVTGTDAAAVTLNSGTGAWSLEETDFATQSSYSFTFTATDGSSNTANQVVAITITEIEVSAALTSLLAIINGNANCAVYDFLLATTGDGSHVDRSNNSNTLAVQFSRTFQSIDASLGGQKHASGMLFQPASDPASGNATLIISLKVDPSDTDFFITPEVRADGTASAIGYAAYVDGTVVSPSTKVALRTAIGTSALKTVRLTDLPDGDFGRGSADWVGYIRRAVLIDEAAITGGDYTDAVGYAETWVAE